MEIRYNSMQPTEMFPVSLGPSQHRNWAPVSTGIGPQSALELGSSHLVELALRARPVLWHICICPKVALIAEHKFVNR